MTRIGPYVLDAELGRGSAGTVWRAHRDGPVARAVAVKRLRAGSGGGDVERLRREAAILAELDHPHIVRVLEVVDDGDGVALAMQYAPGGSLEDLLARRGRLDPGEVVAVAAPVADALASAHRRGVLHGDVKPANVLFTSDGEPLLSDFGVARSFGRPVAAGLTDPGTELAGTVGYLAPDLFDGAARDPRADVYALGVVCYLALTGRLPHEGATPLAMVRAAERGDHPPLTSVPGVPPALAAVVESAMASDPTARTASAVVVARALRSAVPAADVALPGLPAAGAPGAPAGPDGAGGGADGDIGGDIGGGAGGGAFGGTRTFGPRPPRPVEAVARRRRRWPLVAGILAAAAGIGLVVGAVRSGDEDGPGAASCPDVRTPDVAPDAQVVEGDTDGNGCPTVGVYAYQLGLDMAVVPTGEAMVLEIRIDDGALRPRRFVLGAPGDLLLLGDWDCDGVDTPALYRPTTGTTSYYDSWAPSDAEALPSSQVEGEAGAEPSAADTDGDGCDEVVLVAPA